MIESQVRLFLSVDISGSTRLKNIKNYHKMIERKNDFDKLTSAINTDQIDEKIYRLILEEDLDWIKTISNTFEDFHSFFKKDIQESIFPWKVLGDELIYSIKIENRIKLHEYILAFYKTLRYHDEKFSKGKEIRLKGSAWTAGFPIKNRIIKIPCPDLFFMEGNEKRPFPHPREDYLGPEMDIGFRIGKCVSPGFLVVSIELAYLLADVKTNEQFNIQKVGWEALKGVWGERSYPIYWLYLPNDAIADFKYEEAYEWEKMNDKFLKNWDLQKNKEVKSEKGFLSDLIKKLPVELGVEIPYFTKEDPIPERHQDILAFLEKISQFDQNTSNQDVTVETETMEPNFEAKIAEFQNTLKEN